MTLARMGNKYRQNKSAGRSTVEQPSEPFILPVHFPENTGPEFFHGRTLGP
jgi:hypothetical protein